MIALATGLIPRPDAPEPHLDHDMRVLRDLKAEGVVKSAYRRLAGPGFYFLLEGPSIDAVRERIDTRCPKSGAKGTRTPALTR
jgi:hypothetical protein